MVTRPATFTQQVRRSVPTAGAGDGTHAHLPPDCAPGTQDLMEHFGEEDDSNGECLSHDEEESSGEGEGEEWDEGEGKSSGKGKINITRVCIMY